ncbi:MAG TPA: RIP metalloprotease RseP [Vicinamibacterales bacterium]|nr:RIP metalloprotease RseP [Vicinamibacterales bacterium]
MTSFLAFLFVLGVLVFVHELGHFLMARGFGVRVLTFSLGFGPKLVRIRRGETEYAISAIPLGGYVKMAGENPDEPLSGRSDEFLSKPKWQRFLVFVMGPVMNLLLAIVVGAFVLYHGASAPAYEREPAVIGRVEADSPAARAGLRPGDRIVEVEGRRIETWEALSMAIAPRANRETEIVALREGRYVRVRLTPVARTNYEVGDIGVEPLTHPEVVAVTPGSPAARAGIRPGDVILGIDGLRDVELQRLIAHIKERPERPVTLTIRRGAEVRDIQVTPQRQAGAGVIGVQLNPFELRTIEPGPLEALRMSLERNWEWTRLIFRTLAGLLTRETSLKQLMGPVGIAELSGGAAEQGWIPLLNLLAIISLNLGLFNLLPIPALDGGHIAILLLEGLRGRDFSMRVKERLLYAGAVVLMVLIVTVIYNDLARVQWLERLLPWR